MYSHILVPIDGSAAALGALDRAVALARPCAARITVLCVIDPYPFTGVGADFAYGQQLYLNAARAEADGAIDAATAKLAPAGIAFDTCVVESHAVWRGIVEGCQSLGADLVVMGSHGRRGLQKLMLGSVTQSVLAHGVVDTLVVRGAGAD